MISNNFVCPSGKSHHKKSSKMPSPTAVGRFVAGVVGLGIGCTTTYLLTKDFQLVKWEPPRKTEDGKPVKFTVSFREMQPLELKPEVAERRKREALQKGEEPPFNKQEMEQIIQEPTT